MRAYDGNVPHIPLHHLTPTPHATIILYRFTKTLQKAIAVKRATIRAVASEAGVSISTVSNVISGRHHQMSSDTRERVLAAMERLNYRPNQVARSLVTNRTATIGLIIGD